MRVGICYMQKRRAILKFHKPNVRSFFNSENVKKSAENERWSNDLYKAPKDAPNLQPREQNGGAGRCSQSGGFRDMGNAPTVTDLEKQALDNENYRLALWTGRGLQITLMTIPIGEKTGIEKHDGTDQIVTVVSGNAEINMGRTERDLKNAIPLCERSTAIIPSGAMHNIKNVGRVPLRLYSIYAPKVHPFGTVDKTKEDAERRESAKATKKTV